MAILTAFMYANETRTDVMPNGQSTQLISTPLLALKPLFIPGQLSFSVVFGITDFEHDKDHTVQYRLLDSNGNAVIDTGLVHLPKVIHNQAPETDGFIGNFDLRNVVLMNKGEYRTELIFDGVKLKDDIILVKEGKLNAGNNGAKSMEP